MSKEQKTCAKCGELKALELFHVDRHKKSGRRPRCSACTSEELKSWRSKNQERVAISKAEWIKSNPDKRRKYRRKYQKKRRHDDLSYRLMCNLRTRQYHALKECRFSAVKGLGIPVLEWRDYLESKFTERMTQENYSVAWVIDHIYPLSKADLTDPAQHAAASHYLNTQPLSPKDNEVKDDTVTVEAEELFRNLCKRMAKELRKDKDAT